MMVFGGGGYPIGVSCLIRDPEARRFFALLTIRSITTYTTTATILHGYTCTLQEEGSGCSGFLFVSNRDLQIILD